MSRWSKISWTMCAISFIILMGARFVLTGWDPLLFVPLSLFLGSLIFSLFFDIRYYIDFLTMRTTKKGLNMGAIILLFFVLIVSINFISLRHNVSWDITKEKVNTLSDPTLNLLNNLDADVKVTVFYSSEARSKKIETRGVLRRYEERSPHFKVEYVDAYVHRMRAHDELGKRRFSGLTAFVEWSDRKVEVSSPITEESLTSALIQVTRGEVKKVYFLTGHGERSIGDGGVEGVKSLAQALEKVSLRVGELNLFDKKVVPIDADVLVMAGPKSPYILSEMEVIEKFLKRGGGIMIAVDPNQKHKLSGWLGKFGVEFKDNLVVSPFLVLTGRGQTATAGRIYDPNHKITRKFDLNTLTIFDWTSELKTLKNSHFEVKELIKTDGNALSVILHPDGKEPTVKTPEQRTIAISVKGKYRHLDLDKGSENTPVPSNANNSTGSSRPPVSGKSVSKQSVSEQPVPSASEPLASGNTESSQLTSGDEFRLVVFGDSDFISEKDIIHYANMDLALNSLAYLAGEEDVLGITPNTWSDTLDKMAPYQMRGVILGGFSIPVMMLIFAGIFFHRRRNL